MHKTKTNRYRGGWRMSHQAMGLAPMYHGLKSMREAEKSISRDTRTKKTRSTTLASNCHSPIISPSTEFHRSSFTFANFSLTACETLDGSILWYCIVSLRKRCSSCEFV